jgi:hypothetical protein
MKFEDNEKIAAYFCGVSLICNANESPLMGFFAIALAILYYIPSFNKKWLVK